MTTWSSLGCCLNLHLKWSSSGCCADCRTWRGPDDPDSSDEEWETDFSIRNGVSSDNPVERHNGIQMRSMMRHIYQHVDEEAETEDRLNEVMMSALEESDNILALNPKGGAGSMPRHDDYPTKDHGIEEGLHDNRNENNMGAGLDADAREQGSNEDRTHSFVDEHNNKPGA